MGLFSSLLSRVFGGPPAPNPTPAPTPQGPATTAPAPPTARLVPDPVVYGYVPVQSSNVESVRWIPGKAVMSVLDPAKKGRQGPQGGAPAMGGIMDPSAGLTQMSPMALVDEQAAGAAPGPHTLGTLEVTFKAKGNRPVSHYQYYDVPRGVYDEMLKSSSKGQFVHRRLKGKFLYRRTR